MGQITRDPYPILSETIGRGKDEMVARRPSVQPHLEGGNYAIHLEGIRGQIATMNDALASEVMAAHLPTSTGDALRDLVATTADWESPDGTSTSVGEIIFTREVVHAVRTDAPAAPNAFDQTSAVALAASLLASFGAHVTSLFDDVTGVGAHFVTDVAPPGTATADMANLCSIANSLKAGFNFHIANKDIAAGGDLAAHLASDTANTIVTQDASPSGSGNFSAQTASAQQRLLILLNAIRRAMVAHFAIEAKGGVILAGTKARTLGDDTTTPSVSASEYEVTTDTFVSPGVESVTAPITATVQSTTANVPLWTGIGRTPRFAIGTPLFDNGVERPFAIERLRAAGGSFGQSDAAVRAGAKLAFKSRGGANAKRVRACSHVVPSVEHVAVRHGRGLTYVHATDASWAQSDAWAAPILRALVDKQAIAYGARPVLGPVRNTLIRVTVTMLVRGPDMLDEAVALRDTIVATARAYFDEREEWWLWTLDGLKNWLSAVDVDTFVSCTYASIRDENGVPIAEPALPASGDPMIHWWLGACEVQFSMSP